VLRLEISQRIDRFIFYTTPELFGSENFKGIAFSFQDWIGRGIKALYALMKD
jgi:hypothetical protein